MSEEYSKTMTEIVARPATYVEALTTPRSIMCLMLILTKAKTEVARSNNTDCDSRANSSTGFSA